MPAERADDEDDWDLDDADDGVDPDDSDDEPTVPCPRCGESILEDSPWCPSCEQYLSEADHAFPARPLWVIVTALICLGLALWWAM